MLAWIALMIGCAPETQDTGTAALEGLTSDAGLYVLDLAPDPDPFVAGLPVALGIALYAASDESGVEGADITVTPWMPDMGHGIADAPVLTELGGGRYEATFTFNMSGAWELQLALDAHLGADTLTVAYEVL